jgi:hypothetical protein
MITSQPFEGRSFAPARADERDATKRVTLDQCDEAVELTLTALQARGRRLSASSGEERRRDESGEIQAKTKDGVCDQAFHAVQDRVGRLGGCDPCSECRCRMRSGATTVTIPMRSAGSNDGDRAHFRPKVDSNRAAKVIPIA